MNDNYFKIFSKKYFIISLLFNTFYKILQLFKMGGRLSHYQVQKQRQISYNSIKNKNKNNDQTILKNGLQFLQQKLKIFQQIQATKESQLDSFQQVNINSLMKELMNQKQTYDKKRLDNLSSSIQNMSLQQYRNSNKQAFMNLITAISEKRNKIAKVSNFLYTLLQMKVLIGQSACGKTSLLNTLFHGNHSISLSGGTTQCQGYAIKKQNKSILSIIDFPGQKIFVTQNNELLEYYLKNLIKFKQIYICYESSMRPIEVMIRFAHAINPQALRFVRTKCDKFNNKRTTLKKTLNQELETDKKWLREWGIIPKIIYTTTSQECDYPGNAQFLWALTEQKSFDLSQLINPQKREQLKSDHKCYDRSSESQRQIKDQLIN